MAAVAVHPLLISRRDRQPVAAHGTRAPTHADGPIDATAYPANGHLRRDSDTVQAMAPPIKQGKGFCSSRAGLSDYSLFQCINLFFRCHVKSFRFAFIVGRH